MPAFQVTRSCFATMGIDSVSKAGRPSSEIGIGSKGLDKEEPLAIGFTRST